MKKHYTQPTYVLQTFDSQDVITMSAKENGFVADIQWQDISEFLQ